MDIRSFFGGSRSKASTVKTPPNPVKPHSSPEDTSSGGKKTRKRRVVLSSSDDSDTEDPVPSKIQKNAKTGASRSGHATRPRRSLKEWEYGTDEPVTSSLPTRSSPRRSAILSSDPDDGSPPQKASGRSSAVSRQQDAGKQPKRKKTIVIESDSDDEFFKPVKVSDGHGPEPRGRQARSGHPRHINDDKKREKKSENHVGSNAGKGTKRNAGHTDQDRSKKVAVNPIGVSDFFKSASPGSAGTANVKRTQKIVASKVPKEAEEHSEDDFNAVLEMIDQDGLDAKSIASSSLSMTESVYFHGSSGTKSGESPKSARSATAETPESMLVADMARGKAPSSENGHEDNYTVVESPSPTKSPLKPSSPPTDLRKSTSPGPSQPHKPESPSIGSQKVDKYENPDVIEVTSQKSDKATSQTGPSTNATVAPSKTKSVESSKPVTPKGHSRQSNASFVQWKQREGPQAIGSRDIPKAVENGLKDLTFVFTGILDYIDRDDAITLVKHSSGRVTSAVSRKTSYVVVGRDAGATKTQKAEQLRVRMLSEDEFLDLLDKKLGKASAVADDTVTVAEDDTSKIPSDADHHTHIKPRQLEDDVNDAPDGDVTGPSTSGSLSVTGKKPAATVGTGTSSTTASINWAEKYKPKTIKQIIGQQGDRSNMNKLMFWLRNWVRWHHSNTSEKKPAKAWGKSDDGSTFRAALLSGAPGIGKSTTAALVCQELGLKYVELNASDTRSKKTLEQRISNLVSSQSIESFTDGKDHNSVSCGGLTHILIMDEIDGMSGNEDRGGMQEVIALIKKSKIPIICICNDRQSQKIRSLANYCFDLRFSRPTVQQIRGAMMSVAFKEGLKISGPIMDDVIASSNQDIRQVIHRLNLVAAQNNKTIGSDQVSAMAKKDVTLNPFEMARLMFSDSDETRKMTLNEKAEKFFFVDYSLMPLFFQENYLRATSHTAKKATDQLDLLSQAADLLTYGDLCEKQIRSLGTWSLLPLQGFYSVVLPGELVKGHLGGMVQFPSWLGKNSKTGKISRLIQQLQGHMALKTSSDTQGLTLDYLPALKSAILDSLLKDDVQPAVQSCSSYDLMREDLDGLLEIAEWREPSAWSKVATKTKTAFTRSYNKAVSALPYYVPGASEGKKRRKGGPGTSAGGLDSQMVDEEGNVIVSAPVNAEEDDDDDAEEAVPQPKKTKIAGVESSTSKGKTGGKGKKR